MIDSIGIGIRINPQFSPRELAPVDSTDEVKKQRPTSRDQELSEEEKKKIEDLKARDREVREHERAHAAAGGGYVKGGARFEYESGPDNRRYAVGGEVSIDTAPAKTPEETINKAETIRRAALAPADPSAQDLKVAAEAASMEASARQKLAEQSGTASKAYREAADASSSATASQAMSILSTFA